MVRFVCPCGYSTLDYVNVEYAGEEMTRHVKNRHHRVTAETIKKYVGAMETK